MRTPEQVEGLIRSLEEEYPLAACILTTGKITNCCFPSGWRPSARTSG